MKKIPVIFDCDPGHDDAIALILAFASEKLDIKALTVCAGNVGVDKTLINARKILQLLGRKVPLAQGAARPLLREQVSAPNIHGSSGMDGALQAEAASPGAAQAGEPANEPYCPEDPAGAIELQRRVITESPEPVTIIATGPLTNLAILLSAFPELKKNIRLISFMGGSTGPGNWTAAAEFNFFADPEAADMVLSSGLPLVMSGLNVTQKALIMKEEIETIRKTGSPVANLTSGILNFYLDSYLKRGFPGAALHDPCAVACLTNPELFTARPCHVTVETQGKYTTGMSLVDLRTYSEAKPNVTVNMDVDREGLIKLLTDAVKSY